MPTLFEIHITTTELDEPLIAEFVAFCATIGAKPILIELPAGRQRQQPMISKVVRLDEPNDIHPILAELEAAFVAAGFPVERVKVEVPTSYITAGKSAFPKFHGGYYEWHGKVGVSDIPGLKELCEHFGGRLSRNALKGAPGQRLVTLRSFQSEYLFNSSVSRAKNMLGRAGYELRKEEGEYCVYDTNKQPDAGWLDVPDITDENYRRLPVFEAFLRRAATLDAPFMVKGSLILRQYFIEPGSRIAADLDFVYLRPLTDEEEARRVFTKWMTTITTMDAGDGLRFRDFRENNFWRRMDYAMNDDFPTTNTDLSCTLEDGSEVDIQLDISWNLPVPVSPIALEYRPEQGAAFRLPSTVPVPLQLSWKIHQSVVAPRPKDLVDVILLLEAYPLNQEERIATLSAFRQECRKDGFSEKRLSLYQDNILARYFEIEDMDLIAGRNPPEMLELEDRISVLQDRAVDVFNVSYLHLNFPALGYKFASNGKLVRAYTKILEVNGLLNV